MDRRVGERVYRELLRFTAEMRDEPDHPARGALDRFLTDLADQLQHDPETRAKGERPKSQLLHRPEVQELIDISQRVERHVMTGLKKVFSPAVEKAKSLMAADAFGRPASIVVRYPQELPDQAARSELAALTGFLDHLYHPASILVYLMGPIAAASYDREPFNGGTVTSLRFRSGAIGTMHLAAGSSGSSPLERVEVIGEGANLVVDNGVELTYYRPAERPPYGRSPSYLVDEAQAPLRWVPEFSLGQLYNKNIFYQGYVPELVHFCRAVLDGVPPSRGTLTDSLEIMRLFEVYRSTPPATWVEFASRDRVDRERSQRRHEH